MSGFVEFIAVTGILPAAVTLFLLFLVFVLTRLVSRARRRWASRSTGAVRAFTVRLVAPRDIGADPWPFPVSFTQWATLAIYATEARVYTGELRPYTTAASIERSAIASVATTEFEWRRRRNFGVEVRLRNGGRFVVGIASLKTDAPRRGADVEAALVVAELQAWLGGEVVPAVKDALAR